MRTKEEKEILTKFFNGFLDGRVGNDLYTSGGSIIWTQIEKGKITRYKEGPSKKFFDGKENRVIDGVLHILWEWKSEEEILSFFQKFGWLVNDDTVKKYSAKFKK